jgi:hypothetical protein
MVRATAITAWQIVSSPSALHVEETDAQQQTREARDDADDGRAPRPRCVRWRTANRGRTLARRFVLSTRRVLRPRQRLVCVWSGLSHRTPKVTQLWRRMKWSLASSPTVLTDTGQANRLLSPATDVPCAAVAAVRDRVHVPGHLSIW